MSDIIERAEAMLTTLAYARSKGIAQAYPDSSVTMVVSGLLAALKAARAENERLRQIVYRTGHNLNKAYRE